MKTGATVLEAKTEPNPQPALNRNAVARGFAWNASFSVVAKIAFPLAGLIISRTLGPTILGIASLLQMTIQLSEVIRDAGLAQTFLIEPEADVRTRSTYTGLALVLAFIPALAILLLTPAMSSFFNQRELLWSLPIISCCLVLNGLGTVPNAMLLRKAEFKRQGMISIIAGGVALFVTIVLVLLGVGFPALVVQIALGCVLSFLLAVRAEPLAGIRFELAEMRSTFRRTRHFIGANVINNVFLMCDIFVIQRLVGAHAAGLYNTSQNIAYKPADLILFPLNKTLMVAFSQSKQDMTRLASTYWRSITAIVLLFVPVYTAIGLNSEAIVALLLGPKFSGGAAVLSILSVYLCFRTFGNISGAALVPAQRHHWTLYPWIAAILTTGAGVALVAAHPTLNEIVWCFTFGAIVVYSAIFLMGVYSLPPKVADLAKMGRTLAATAGTVGFIVLVRFLHVGNYATLAVVAFGCPPVHLMLVGLAFERNPFAFLSKQGIKRLWAVL